MFTNPAKVIYGFKEDQVITGDFLEWKTDMKFSVILGNPPYLNGLWTKFFDKSVSLANGHVALVSPDGTGNFSTRSEKFEQFLLDNGLQQKIECTDHFPSVNSGKIVYYLLDITKKSNPDALLDKSIDGAILRKIINDPSPKLNGFLSNKRGTECIRAARSKNKTKTNNQYNLETVSKEGPEFAWVAVAQTHVINGGDYWLTNRYFGKNSFGCITEVNGDIGISTNVLAIQKIPNWTSAEFEEVYLSPVFRFVLNVLRKGGFDTSPRHIKQLPIVKKIGKELYQHFNLTQEEIDYIEKTVK